MHVILISGGATRTKTFTILPRQIAVFAFVLLLFSFALSILFSWAGVYFNMPFVQRMVITAQEIHNREIEEYTRDNIKAMAVRLGEMRAQLVRLDLLGERISETSGIPFVKHTAAQPGSAERQNDTNDKGSQGGRLVRIPHSDFLMALQRDIERFSESITSQSESLTALESQLMERKIKSTLLPTLVPINARAGSGFGIRVDPIDGGSAMHEGIDFAAEVGTPIIASAGGIVTAASFHRQYGNRVEIDHGHDFSSRYAHMSRLDVKQGQIVKRGQQVGLSGNTGRTTGPHLHFEVRFKGVAQNPARFFAMGEKNATDILAMERNASPEKSDSRTKQERVEPSR